MLLNSSVWPSLGALATASAPMVLPAPARFSTITRPPSRAESCSASSRASVSVGPPGAKGSTMRTGRAG